MDMFKGMMASIGKASWENIGQVAFIVNFIFILDLFIFK